MPTTTETVITETFANAATKACAVTMSTTASTTGEQNVRFRVAGLDFSIDPDQSVYAYVHSVEDLVMDENYGRQRLTFTAQGRSFEIIFYAK